MLKKIFAASAAVVGIAGILGAGDAFAAVTTDSYALGQEISLIATEYSICVHKDGGYAGDLIAADIRGANYEKQIVFGDTTDDEQCTPVGDIPADGKLKYVTPMGLSNMAYVQSEDSTNNRVELNLNDSTMLGKYLRSYGQSTTRTGKSATTINFDANGGTGALPVIAGATIGSSVTLPKSTLVREGYKFTGWNTKADGTGTPYTDEATITVEEPGQIQLFAQWVATTTTLDTGRNVNAAIKTLAAGSSMSYSSADARIKELEFVDTLPAAINDNTPKVNIALSGEEPVYAYWVANEEKIYINTEMDTIYANRDSSNMFRRMEALTSLTLPTSFNTAKVTDMSYMFSYMSTLTSLTLPTLFDTTNVTTMDCMFAYMYALTSLTLPESFDTANVTNMASMFSGMRALASLTFPTSFNTAKVTDMRNMFFDMPTLTSLTLPESFDTANVTNMSNMFYYMPALASLDLPTSFNTANVTTMRGMFSGMSALTSLNLPTSFNTANVTNMRGMFSDMSALTSLNLPTSFNTANVTNMEFMFSGMSALTSLTLPNSFVVNSGTTTTSIFTSVKNTAKLYATDSTIRSLWPGVLGD